MSLGQEDSKLGGGAQRVGLVCSAIAKWWMCLQRASSFPATPPSSQPDELLARLPSSLLPPWGSASWRNSSLCPSTLLRTVGWLGTSTLPAGNCFREGCCEAWAPCHIPGPLPRPWPTCLGWNSVPVLGPSDSHTPSPEVLRHQVDSVRVSWMPAGCKTSHQAVALWAPRWADSFCA